MTEEKKPKAKKTTAKKAPKEADKKIEEAVEAIAEEVVADVKTHTPGRPWVKWAIGGVVLVGLVLFALSRGNEMIAKPFIETQLAKVAENIASQAALSGDGAKLTYGEVSVAGGIFNKKATISDLQLEYTVQLPFGNVQQTTINTPTAEVTADQIKSHAINIKFPEPFTLTREGYQPLSLTFDGKPIYTYQFGEQLEEHQLDLPNHVILGVGTDSNDPVEVAISYASGATLERQINQSTGENKSHIQFSNVTLTSNVESNEIRVAGFEVRSNERSGEPGIRQFKSQVDITDVEIQQLDKLSGPYSLGADVSGDYKVTKVEEGVAGVTHVNMTVKQFNLKAKDYDVSVVGQFSRVPEDPMLFGSGDVTIQGLDAFRNSELIDINDDKLKDTVIGLVTGNQDVAAKEAAFTVKREQNGTFFIGQTTFENLIGTVVTHVLSQQKQPATAPAAPVPAEPAPAATPIPNDPVAEPAQPVPMPE